MSTYAVAAQVGSGSRADITDHIKRHAKMTSRAHHTEANDVKFGKMLA